MKKIILLILLTFFSVAGYSQLLNEGFEGAPTTPDAAGVWALPSSSALGTWFVTDNLAAGNPAIQWKLNTASFPANTGSNAAFIDRENTGAGVLSQEWLITPQLNIQANTQLRFFTRQTIIGSPDPQTIYRVLASSSASQSDLTAFTTVLAEYDETTLSTLTPDQLDYEEKLINLGFSGLRYIAFVKVYTQPTAATSGDRWLVDDVRTVIRCIDPIAPLGVNSITTTSATLTWSMPAGSTQTQFEIEYGLSGFTQGTGTVIPVTTAASGVRSYNLTGLLDTTAYQFYVRSVCTDSNSLWVGPFNFNTLPRGTTCAEPIIVTPLPYSSASNTGLYANNITAGTPGTNCGGGAGFLGGNDVVYSYTVPATTTGVISVTMDPQGQANTGVFVYANCASVGTNCIAGVGNNNGTIRTIPVLNVTSGQTIYVVISSTAAVGTFPYVLTIQEVNCPPPTSLSAVAIDTTNASLSWQAPSGGAPGYEYYVQTAGSPIPSTAGVTVVNPTAIVNTLTGTSTPLVVGTNYQYWVRADCGNGTFSPWAGPYIFQTTSCTTGACSYTFVMTDSFGDGWNGALMDIVQNSVVVATIGSTFTGGVGPVAVTVQLCNSVPFSLVWTTAGNFPGEVGISIVNSFNQTIFTKPSGTGAAGPTPIFTGTVDCNTPLCLAPTGLLVSNISTYGAQLEWTPNGPNPVSWDVYVVTTGSPAPTAGSTPTYTTTSNPFTITQATLPQGLLPDTAYTFYVRANCTGPATSPWSGASASFTTLPTCPKPTGLVLDQFDLNSIRFDWVPGGTETAWEYIITLAGDPAPLATDPGWNPTTVHPVTALFLPPGTAFDFYVRAICTPGTDESTIAGPVTGNTTLCTLAEQCTYTFTLNDSFGDGWNGARMEVRQNGIAIATLGANFTDGNGPIVVTVPLCTGVPFELFWTTAGTFPGEVRIAVSNNFDQTLFAITTPSAALAGTSLYTTLVDCAFPACLPPNNLTSSNITAHEAELNWTQNGTVAPTSWEIYAVPAGSPAPTDASVGIIVSSTLAPPYTATGLLADTDYVFYIRAICVGSSTPTSPWSGVSPIFHTLPTCPKPTGLLVSNSDMNSLQFSWIPGGAETAWEYLFLPAGSPAPTAASTGWIPSTTTIVTVTGLDPATAYDFYVRGICTPDTDISTISGPASGNTTICAAAEQCNFIFTLTDSFGDGWNGATMQIRQNGIVVATIGSTFTGGDGPIVINVPICPGIPVDLFWNNAGTFPGEVRISVSNNFQQVLYSLTTSSANLVGTVLYSLADPSCTVPICQTPVALNATPFTFNASLTWNFISFPGVSYDVYVVPAGSPAPTAGTTPTYTGVTTNPFLTDVTGPNALTQLTDYTFYVRMVCDSGPTPWSTGSNFTTLPTCPQPQSLSAETTTTDATITFNEVGPATSWEVWVLPTGSPAPAPGTGTIFNQTPVGGVVTINTLAPAPNGLGLTLFPGLYNFYVRSICSPTDASAPITGPLSFFIQNVDPICASVVPSNPDIDANGVINLCPVVSPAQNCVALTATYTDNRDTTSYVVESIPFSPPFPFEGGTELDISTDDIWGPVFNLPFNFCFFGTNYPSVQVGSNGVMTFTTPQPGFCPWNTDTAITVPNPAFPIRNAIYGVYQDINPAVSTAPIVHTINYQVLGTAPCRTFVLNFVNIAQFSCGTSVGLQTSQIVLYETSNNIEVYVKDRTVCANWNEGSGVIGIQNAAGTIGYTPPGRNLGPWEAHNEAWKFKPDGASNVVFSWLQDGAFYSNNTDITVCIDDDTVMTAQAVYNGCGGVVTTKTSDVLLNINGVDVLPIPNVTTCQCYTLPALAVGNYYTLPGGQGTQLPAGTVLCTDQTVYVYAELVNATQTCTDEESFTITIAPVVAPDHDDVSVCGPYVLENLNNPDFNYYTESGGLGTMYAGTGGDVISSTATIYIFGTVGDCNAENSFLVEIGVIAPTTPTFDPIADICVGGTAPQLPLISTNGISGTWSPSAIITTNPGTTCYTFTPNPDQLCTITAQLCVTISNQIVPTFAPVASVCQNTAAPILPTISQNLITGTWSAIDTSISGPQVVTFTPDAGQPCAISTNISVTIDPSVTATFAPIQDLCQNSVPPVLPLTSGNGITGTWSPAAIDTSVIGSTVYTFTPDAGQPCASGTTLTVNIIAPVQPDFAPITICHSTPAPVLNNTSPNGITGTWTPAVIDNTLSACYTFTPDAGQCALTQQICVTVSAQISPDFAPIADFCAGTQAPLLAGTSPNGIAGTWSPAVINNQQNGCYVFTPNAGLCAEPQTLCVTVTPRETPDFIIDGTVCPGEAVPVLGTSSPNGVQGTWSPQVVSSDSATYVFTPDAGECANTQTVTVNVITMPDLQFQTGCVANNYLIQLLNPIQGASYTWSHNQQAIANATTPTINLTQLNTGTGDYTVNITNGGCTTSESITVLNISCDIQKGISPKGNSGDGLNDSFDLTGQNVSRLEIFNRYGSKVYAKNNYGNEWYGQSDKGEELPDGTYYYVIEYTNGGSAKTGWIYINREQ